MASEDEKGGSGLSGERPAIDLSKLKLAVPSPEAESIIINAMGWRTNQQVRANYLVAGLTIPRLLEAISKKDLTAVTGVKTPEGVAVFKSDEARSIL